MLTSPDFKELLKIFEKFKIRYLVVGGYAVMKYSEPQFTKDLDVFIATDAEGRKIKSILINSRKPNNWIHLTRNSAPLSFVPFLASDP